MYPFLYVSLFVFLSYYPLKQGLKPGKQASILRNDWLFLSYYPLKQGLKHSPSCRRTMSCNIFILLSIKTRIETIICCRQMSTINLFLSYYPLKQGLKLCILMLQWMYPVWFLSYYPLKQGLKHIPSSLHSDREIYFYPTIH